MSPKEFVAAWSKENSEYAGLLMVNREEPAGKKGRKRKIITRRFVVSAGLSVRQKVHSAPGLCHFRENGECQCCHRVFLDCELTRKKSAFTDPAGESGLIHVGLFCERCRRAFDYPMAGPTQKMVIEIDHHA